MKIVKPSTLGLLHQPYTQGGRHRLVVVALGFFDLGSQPAPRLLTEAPQWARLLAAMPAGQVLDEVRPKAMAEMLVFGSACTPGGVPSRTLELRVALQRAAGGIDKRLRASGARHWQIDDQGRLHIGEPEPFTRLKLDHREAYGGPGFATNPLGRGHEAGRAQADGQRVLRGLMPAIEYADAPWTDPNRPARPANLLPIPIEWPQRLCHAGTAAGRGPTQAPGLPADLDWRVYNQAPEDQRCAGWFDGGEAYLLQGLSAEQPMWRGRLPAQRARAFVASGSAGAAAEPPPLRELAMHMDTVWFLPDAGLGVVAWRGRTEIADSEARDVHALLLAYEDATQAARPPAHYEQVLRQRLTPQEGGLHAFDEAQLAPALSAETRARDLRDAAAAEDQARARQQAFAMALTPPQAGSPSPTRAPSASLPQLTPPSANAIARGDFELSTLAEQTRKLVEQVDRQAQQKRQSVPAMPRSAHAPPAPSWEQLLQRAAAPRPPPGSIAALQAQARSASPVPVSEAQPLPPELAQRLGRQVLAWAAAGVPLDGHDFAGIDLRGATLAGLDLRGCLLERADLRQADLRGCRLDGAVLCQALLDGADLRQARLADANLCGSAARDANLAGAGLQRVRARGARWAGVRAEGATIESAQLDQADLQAARLDRAELNDVLLSEVDASHSRWREARLSRCIGWKMQAAGADFSGSRWTRSALLSCDASDSLWAGARLEQLHAGSACFKRADLRGLRAQRCNWAASDLSASRFDRAGCSDCDFSGADLSGASLLGGCFARSLFSTAQLRGAAAADADFFQALLRKADLRGADLQRANLMQADATGADWRGSLTRGAQFEAHRVPA